MKNRIIFAVGAFLLLIFLLAFSPLALHAQIPQSVQKTSGSLSNGGFHVPSGVTVDAIGTGAIAATTSTKLTTGRTLAITGDLAYTSPSFDGSGNVTAAGTLATVNANVGSFGSATKTVTLTVNAKGLVTAVSEQTATPAVGSITGLGTGVAAALAVNNNSAGGYSPIDGTATLSNKTLSSPVLSGTLTGSGIIAGSTIINTSGAITGGAGSFTTLGASGPLLVTGAIASHAASRVTLSYEGSSNSYLQAYGVNAATQGILYVRLYSSDGSLATIPAVFSPTGLAVTGLTNSTSFTAGSPTGGDKGSGTANFAADIYKNNTAYTNPDYVLEKWATGNIVKFAGKDGAKGYSGLRPLSEVEQFASVNYHLPRFGQEAGHGLFSGSDALLASVEEAYLYLFAQEHRIDALEAHAAAPDWVARCLAAAALAVALAAYFKKSNP